MTLHAGKAVAILVSIFGTVSLAPMRAQTVENLEPGVVKIVAHVTESEQQIEGVEKVGTGFIVRLNENAADIVTASHVAQGTDQLRVFFFADPYRPFTATTLQIEGGQSQGVAVIRVQGTIPAGALALTLKQGADITVNDAVSFIGFPIAVGTPWAVGHGVVSGYKGQQITFSGDIQEGNSGGPLIKDAEVVGVITDADAKNGYATPASTVLATLKGWKIIDDYQIAHDRAEAYLQRREYKQYIQAAEDLLHNQAILNQLPSQERWRKEVLLHVEIAYTLLEGNYIEGVDNCFEKALFHAEQARLAAPDNFLIQLLLGYATAALAEKQLNDPTSKRSDVDQIFGTAKQIIVDVSMTEDARSAAMVNYHLWYGRSLSVLKDYTRANAELQSGLLIAQRNMPQMSHERDDLLFQLGGIEWKKTLDVDAATAYWKDIANQYYVGNALVLIGLADWAQGNEALRSGNQRKAQDKFNAAEKTLAAAKRMGHISSQSSLTLGSLYFDRGDFVNAAASYEDATRIEPSSGIAFYFLGRSLLHIRGRLTDARRAMERAAQLQPQDAEAYYYLSFICGADKDMSCARTAAEKAVELNPKLTQARYTLTLSTIGQAEEQKTNSVEQIATYEKALSFANAGISACEAEKDDPTAQSIIQLKPGIWNSLAYSYAERGEYLGLAVQYIDSALKAEPANPSYLDTKAWILIRTAELSKDTSPVQRQQMFADAEALLNQAIASYSEKDTEAKAETFYHMGYKDKLQGKMDKARELFLKALQLDPGYEKAKKEMM